MIITIWGKLIKNLLILKYIIFNTFCIITEDTGPAYQRSDIYISYFDILKVVLT